MGVFVTPQEKIDQYFESDALSQSMLKKLIGGIDVFLNSKKEEKELFYSEKGSLITGSAVDTLLTGEVGEFEKQYHISNLTVKPSAVEMSITQRVFEEVVNHNKNNNLGIKTLNDYPGSLDAAIVEEDWYGGKPGEKRITGLITRCTDYFEDLKKGIGKQILTTEEHKMIKDIVFNLKSNVRTARYFDRKYYENHKNVDIYYQLPIYFYYKGVYCKALLDMLIVYKDDLGLIGIQPVDLKTMNGSTLKFLSSIKSWRYDIQAAWYTEALSSKDSSFTLPGLEPHLIAPFKFIVESSNFPGQPLVYQVDEEIMKIGKFGKKDLTVKTPNYEYPELVKQGYKGFDELIDIYLYQNENDWKEEEIITKSNGVLKLGWNGIKE